MIRRSGLLVAVSILVAGCASGPLPEPSYPASHPANPEAAAPPFVRPVNLLAGDVFFGPRDEGSMVRGSPESDHSALTHEERVDASAIESHAAAGTGAVTSGTEARGGSQLAQAEPAVGPSGTGTINAVDIEHRTVNISHDPIPAIGWPAMTMDMAVAPSVDLDAVAPGSQVTFSLSRGADGVYVIGSLSAGSEGGAMPGMGHGGMDHGTSMPGMRHQ